MGEVLEIRDLRVNVEGKEILRGVNLTVEQGEEQTPKRRYQELALERPRIYFLPLSWTLVHVLDQSSPLFGKTAAELDALQVLAERERRILEKARAKITNR